MLYYRFPGPLNIGLSVPRYLLGIACSGIVIVAGIGFIRFADSIAATLATSHGVIRGVGLLYLLVLLGVAKDMPDALVEFGLFALAFFGAVGLIIVLKLVLSVMGMCGLTLDREGFIVKDLNRSIYHRWLDVGDFDSLELPVARRVLGMRKCLAFNDYRAPETSIGWLRGAGRNRALIEAYEYRTEDLACLCQSGASGQSRDPPTRCS